MFWLLAICIIVNSATYSQELAYIFVGGKYGYINKIGEIAITPIYTNAHGFNEGLALVRDSLRWAGYIDKTGKYIIKPKFGQADDFSEGLACVEDVKLGYGYIDKKGKYIIPPKYNVARRFSEGLAAVRFNGWWGFIDKTGRIIIKPNFIDVNFSGFKNGRIRVNYVDISKDNILRASDAMLRGATPSQIWRFDHKNAFINRNGNIAINLDSLAGGHDTGQDEFDEFSEGLRAFEKLEKFGYIDTTGKIVIEPLFDCAFRFSEGVAAVKIDNKWGFIEKTGKYVIEPKFTAVGSYHEGFAKVQIECSRSGRGAYGFVNRKGEIVVAPAYYSVRDFSCGLAAIESDNGQWGFIDTTGNMVIEPIFDYVGDFK